jgi:hypothetical protein
MPSPGASPRKGQFMCSNGMVRNRSGYFHLGRLVLFWSFEFITLDRQTVTTPTQLTAKT